MYVTSLSLRKKSIREKVMTRGIYKGEPQFPKWEPERRCREPLKKDVGGMGLMIVHFGTND